MCVHLKHVCELQGLTSPPVEHSRVNIFPLNPLSGLQEEAGENPHGTEETR